MFLLDTNVVSELRKVEASSVNHKVKQWAKETPGEQTYISVVTVFELERGVLLTERRDALQGKVLRQWFTERVLTTFEERIIPISLGIARRCAQLHVPDPKSDYDALIAATALEHGLTVVTRNTSDFLTTGVKLLNPWESL